MSQSTNQALLSQALKVYLSNRRQGTSKVNTRGEVAGSGKKIWRQKGTGHARHGDRQAPLFVGGGVAHGPKGNQNYERRLPKKMKQLALKTILNLKKTDKKLITVQTFKLAEVKTKALAKMIAKLDGYKPGQKITLVASATEIEPLRRAGRNLSQVQIISAKQINAYDLWRGGIIVMSKEAKNELK